MYSVLVNYKLFILVLVFFSWQINLFFQKFFEILFATARYGGVRSSFAGGAKKNFRARSSFAPPFLNSCIRPCTLGNSYTLCVMRYVSRELAQQLRNIGITHKTEHSFDIFWNSQYIISQRLHFTHITIFDQYYYA